MRPGAWLVAAAAVQRAWAARAQLALDWDVLAEAPVPVQTCAGLAPIFVPHLDRALADRVVMRLLGKDFATAPGLAYAVVPSTVPGSPGFQPRTYWRGPTWPVINWLYWWGLQQHGFAAALREANLALLSRPEAQFAEYFEPYTAEPLGSRDQSWAAAVTLDWLAPR